MRTLIIGSGFIGQAVADRLADAGHEPVLAARHRPTGGSASGPDRAWTALDVTDPAACAAVLDRVGPDSLVLVHGPSDVTWCEANPDRAHRLHVAAAANIAAAADGRRVVFISTDNVFDGVAPFNDEDSEPRPGNAYGRAKLAAELVVRDIPEATILRVSLVYGWEPSDGSNWLNFFASCVDQLRRGQSVAAPDDHWTTPVLIDDVAAVTAAVVGGSGPAVLHLGGPDRLTRAQWAAAIADRLGVSPRLVVPTPRALGRYASRPVNACLSSRLLARQQSTAHLPVRGVRDGIDLLLDQAPISGGAAA
jgi:dTDP-4-dehydrorhamnose reductase